MTRFSQYNSLLQAVSFQMDLLRHYNKTFWDGFFSEEEFAAARLPEDGPQTIEQLHLGHAAFGSLELDIEMWWRVFEALHPGQSNAVGMAPLQTEKRLFAMRYSDTARQYPRGIHPIIINLVGHWADGDNGPHEYRAMARAAGENLGHTEILSAYGLHPALLRLMDGENLPYADLTGIEAEPEYPRKPFEGWPYLCYDMSRAAMFVRYFSNNTAWATATVSAAA